MGVILLALHLPEVNAKSVDADDGSADIGIDERSRRMEMLRSMNSGAQSTKSPAPQYQDNADRYSTHEKSHAEQQLVRRITPDRTMARPVSRPKHIEPSPYPIAAKAVTREKKAHPSTFRATSQPVVKTPLKKRALRARKSLSYSSSQAHRTPKCGFCLVDGYLHCGDQGVALETLIKQDQRQKKLKNSRPRKHSRHPARHH